MQLLFGSRWALNSGLHTVRVFKLHTIARGAPGMVIGSPLPMCGFCLADFKPEVWFPFFWIGDAPAGRGALLPLAL